MGRPQCYKKHKTPDQGWDKASINGECARYFHKKFKDGDYNTSNYDAVSLYNDDSNPAFVKRQNPAYFKGLITQVVNNVR